MGECIGTEGVYRGRGDYRDWGNVWGGGGVRRWGAACRDGGCVGTGPIYRAGQCAGTGGETCRETGKCGPKWGKRVGFRARKRCTNAGEKGTDAVRQFAATAVARGSGEETRERCGRRERKACGSARSAAAGMGGRAGSAHGGAGYEQPCSARCCPSPPPKLLN